MSFSVVELSKTIADSCDLVRLLSAVAAPLKRDANAAWSAARCAKGIRKPQIDRCG